MSDFQTKMGGFMPHGVVGEIASNSPTTAVTMMEITAATGHKGLFYSAHNPNQNTLYCRRGRGNSGSINKGIGISIAAKSSVTILNKRSEFVTGYIEKYKMQTILTKGTVFIDSHRLNVKVGDYVFYHRSTGWLITSPSDTATDPSGIFIRIRGAEVVYKSSVPNNTIVAIKLTGIQ